MTQRMNTLSSSVKPSLQQFLKKAEQSYRGGNRYFRNGNLEAAQSSWQVASCPGTSSHGHVNTKEVGIPFWKTIVAVLLATFSIYTIIFIVFPRQSDSLSQWILAQQDEKPRSFWDEWWNTGRPSMRFIGSNLGTENFLPILRENLQRLLNQNKNGNLSTQQELEKWLSYNQKGLKRDKPVNYYILAGRGFFNSRQFDEAISTYQEGLFYATNSDQYGELFQELGTAYYYKGYRLQPDGLAEYNLPLVQNSVESYLEAEKHTQGPYLYGNMGWGFYLLKDFEKAVEYSERALALKHNLVYVRMNLGISYIRMGEYSKAFLAYQSIGPFNPETSEYDGGIRDLRELQLQHPMLFPFTDFILGYMLMEQGKFLESRKTLLAFIDSAFPFKVWRQKAKGMIRQMANQ